MAAGGATWLVDTRSLKLGGLTAIFTGLSEGEKSKPVTVDISGTGS